MTSKLYYKAMFEDICLERCSDTEIKILLDIYERTVKKLATTLAYYAEYRLEDFATAKQHKLENFTLRIEKRIICGQEQWHGRYEHGRKNLTIIATLEAPI